MDPVEEVAKGLAELGDEWEGTPELWAKIADRYKDEDVLNHPLFCDEVKDDVIASGSNPAMNAMMEIQRELLEEDPYGVLYMKSQKEHGNEFMLEAAKARRDGNKSDNIKNLNLSLLSYTKGLEHGLKEIDDRLTDEEKLKEKSNMEGLLLSNRAQTNILLNNWGDARIDAIEASKKVPDNVKAFYRAALSCLQLSFEKEAIEYSEKALALNPPTNLSNLINDIRRRAQNRLEEELNVSKQNQSSSQSYHNSGPSSLTLSILNDRKIKLNDNPMFYAGGIDQVLKHHPIATCNCDESERVPNALHWTVLFLFPEYSISHTATDVCDTDVICQALSELLPASENAGGGKYCPWDKRQMYTYDKIWAYLEGVHEDSDRYIVFDPIQVPFRTILDKYGMVTKLPVVHIIPRIESAVKMFEEGLTCASFERYKP